MFPLLNSVRTTLESVSASFDAALLDGAQASAMVDELGAIRRLVDRLLIGAAKRIDDTHAFRASGAKDAATALGRSVGVPTSEARRTIDLARRLTRHPLTDAAVRAGTLSQRQAERTWFARNNTSAQSRSVDRAGTYASIS